MTAVEPQPRMLRRACPLCVRPSDWGGCCGKHWECEPCGNRLAAHLEDAHGWPPAYFCGDCARAGVPRRVENARRGVHDMMQHRKA